MEDKDSFFALALLVEPVRPTNPPIKTTDPISISETPENTVALTCENIMAGAQNPSMENRPSAASASDWMLHAQSRGGGLVNHASDVQTSEPACIFCRLAHLVLALHTRF
jgi:hypothetical protein